MSETAILEQLKKLTEEIHAMKADIQELKDGLKSEPVKQPMVAKEVVFEEVPELDLDGVQLRAVCDELLTGLDGFREMTSTLRSGQELVEDLQPVIKQVYPRAIKFCADLEGDFDLDELVVLLRKTVANLDTLGEGIDLLKAGVELRDDMIPIIQLVYPKLLKALTALHEGEFRAERLGDLLHTVLLNIHTLSDLLNMIQPFTELVKEVTVILQQTDVLTNMNKWLDSLQSSNPVLRLATTAVATAKKLDFNEERVAKICEVLKTVDLNNIEPLGPIGMIRQLRDPKVQEALGFCFMLLQTTGGCLQAWGKPRIETVKKVR